MQELRFPPSVCLPCHLVESAQQTPTGVPVCYCSSSRCVTDPAGNVGGLIICQCNLHLQYSLQCPETRPEILANSFSVHVRCTNSLAHTRQNTGDLTSKTYLHDEHGIQVFFSFVATIEITSICLEKDLKCDALICLVFSPCCCVNTPADLSQSQKARDRVTLVPNSLHSPHVTR